MHSQRPLVGVLPDRTLMKFSAQEEYGLRCLLQLGRLGPGASVTIQEISKLEKLSPPYVAKMMRQLRKHGFVQSVRGQTGGYALARRPREIVIGDVLAALGGRLFHEDFCNRYSGQDALCTHNVDCSIRSLWSAVQVSVDRVVMKTTLGDLLGTEEETREHGVELAAEQSKAAAH